MGLAGRASYNWNYRYFIDFNFGYNGSENFADGHRFGFFPAFSLAWNIAEEKFIKKHLEWMNMFKLRYSYGKVGNDKLGERFPYLYTIAKSYKENDKDVTFPGWNWGDYGYGNSYDGMAYTQLASENVTWEIATKHDIGVDLSLFNDIPVVFARKRIQCCYKNFFLLTVDYNVSVFLDGKLAVAVGI